MDYTPYSPDLVASDLLFFGPLKKHSAVKGYATDTDVEQAQLSKDMQQTQMWSKLSPPNYRHLTQISSVLSYKPWCHSGSYDLSWLLCGGLMYTICYTCTMYTLMSE
jgi:hypothetical protein